MTVTVIHGVDQTPGHDVEEEDFARAAVFLGGVVGEGPHGEVVLSWSPRAQRSLAQPARTMFLTFARIPEELIWQVMDGAHDAREALPVRNPCRRCRPRGRLVEATHALWPGSHQPLALCDECWALPRPAHALIPAPPQQMPVHGVFCAHCAAQVMHGPHTREQQVALGRLRLCAACWQRDAIANSAL